MSEVVYTPPAIEPVGLEELKLFLRLGTETTLDDEIAGSLAAARVQLEALTNRCGITQTRIYRRDAWPSTTSTLYLPSAPVASVTSFRYRDSTGTWIALASPADYSLDNYTEPARLTPALGTAWPTLYGAPNDIEITYVVGYGSTPASVPEDYKRALKLMVGDALAYHQDTVIVQGGSASPIASKMALAGLLTALMVYDLNDGEEETP